MRVNDRLDVVLSRLGRGSLLFCLSFPALWIGWVFYAFEPVSRGIVIRYGLGRLFFKLVQRMDVLVNWVGASGDRPAGQTADQLVRCFHRQKCARIFAHVLRLDR